MSRIIRGIAVIMMVFNHCMPGKIIAIAVPLFSFLVGYGYAFARERSVRHSLKRIWHLLSYYWLIVVVLVMPAAIIGYHKPIPLSEIVLSLFGLSGMLDAYCWYIYFYIIVMLLMPVLSRLIDRYSLKAVFVLIAICAAISIPVGEIPKFGQNFTYNIVWRFFRYLPVVISGYYVARKNLVAYVRVPKHPMTAIGALCIMVGIYFLRGWTIFKVNDLPATQLFNFIWIPIFVFATATIFNLYSLKPLFIFLTQMGLKSMNIWLIHALFFTRTTRAIYGVLVNWISWKPGLAIVVLLLSFVFSVVIDLIMKFLTKSIISVKIWLSAKSFVNLSK